MMKNTNIAIPILPSLDLKRSLKFYGQNLGFKIVGLFDDYAMIVKDEIEIHFWKCDDKYLCDNSACYIRVSDVEAWYGEYQTKGIIHPHGALEIKSWGMKEFAVLDYDGNLIRIGEMMLK